jgi:hypothetical protein
MRVPRFSTALYSCALPLLALRCRQHGHVSCTRTPAAAAAPPHVASALRPLAAVPLTPHSGSGAYKAAFERVVLPALEAYQPQLLLVSAGYDPAYMDMLVRVRHLFVRHSYSPTASVRTDTVLFSLLSGWRAGVRGWRARACAPMHAAACASHRVRCGRGPQGAMCLSSADFGWMMAQLRAAADRLCGGRLVALHEGGYSELYGERGRREEKSCERQEEPRAVDVTQ